MFGIIYKLTCKINSKGYIGLTTQTLNERWNQHKSKAHSMTSNLPIHCAINKYGEDNFSIETIDIAMTENELKQKEIQWIAYYNSTNRSLGYNITLGGESGNGYHHSEESKKKISEHSIGRKKSAETVERMKKSSTKNSVNQTYNSK